MARVPDPTFIYHADVEREILFSGQARDLVDRVGTIIAREAADDAPKDSGAGARSIQSVPRLTPDGWQARVSWTRRHYYLYMHEKGWQYRPAKPFLRPAIDRARGQI